MKKELTSLAIITMLFGLAGCNGSQSGADGPLAAYIEKDITSISIVHYLCGSPVQWTIENEELDELMNWAFELKCRPLQCENGQTPGDSNGGEFYSFSPAEGGCPEFSYVINGPGQYYLLAEGNWYSVVNPSKPPVTEPHGETLTLEKVKELARHGETLSWKHFAQYDYKDIGSGLYIYRYDIDENYYLVIGGGNTLTIPAYIRLVLNTDNSKFIDIRTENIDDFINNPVAEPVALSSPLDGVTMTVTEASDTAITVRITNDTEREIQCGEDFCLKKLEEDTGTWKALDAVIDNAAFKSIAYWIPGNSPREMEIAVEWLYGKLQPGRYCITKTITDFRGTGDYTNYTFSAEFCIEE